MNIDNQIRCHQLASQIHYNNLCGFSTINLNHTHSYFRKCIEQISHQNKWNLHLKGKKQILLILDSSASELNYTLLNNLTSPQQTERYINNESSVIIFKRDLQQIWTRDIRDNGTLRKESTNHCTEKPGAPLFSLAYNLMQNEIVFFFLSQFCSLINILATAGTPLMLVVVHE